MLEVWNGNLNGGCPFGFLEGSGFIHKPFESPRASMVVAPLCPIQTAPWECHLQFPRFHVSTARSCRGSSSLGLPCNSFLGPVLFIGSLGHVAYEQCCVCLCWVPAHVFASEIGSFRDVGLCWIPIQHFTSSAFQYLTTVPPEKTHPPDLAAFFRESEPVDFQNPKAAK